LMLHFSRQMHAQARQGKFLWKRNLPISDRQRDILENRGFLVGEYTVHWSDVLPEIPIDCFSFYYYKTRRLPSHYNEAQRLWIIAKRHARKKQKSLQS